MASVVLLALGALTLRPAITGSNLSSVGLGLVYAAAVMAVIYDHRRPAYASRAAKSLLLWVTLFWLWELWLLIYPGVDSGQAFKGAASVVGGLGAAVLVLRDPWRQRLFLRLFIGVFALLSVSAMLTLLWHLTGHEPQIVGTFDSTGYGVQPIYAPFTPVTGWVDLHGWLIPRFTGLMREPGLMQALLIWSYFLLGRAGWDRWWLRVILIGGVLCTLSAAGFGIFVVAWAISAVIVRAPDTPLRPLRQYLGVWAVLAGAALTLWAPVVGLVSKGAYAEASLVDRSTATKAGLSAIVNHPLGGGAADGVSNTGINLLAAISLIGVPGLILALIAYLRPLALSEYRADAFLASLPLIATSVLSQPVLDAPTWWIALLVAVGASGRSRVRDSAVEPEMTGYRFEPAQIETIRLPATHS